VHKEHQLASYVYQICSALNYLHSKNISHKDIKLENIMFFDESHTHIKLIDFDFSETISNY